MTIGVLHGPDFLNQISSKDYDRSFTGAAPDCDLAGVTSVKQL
jgi:hypothetical protein